VGTPETLRLHQLLLALMERGVELDKPERLARYLGPVLCRSASQQSLFEERLASWWAQVAAMEAVAEHQALPPNDLFSLRAIALENELEGLEGRQRWLRRGLELAKVGAVVVALALVPLPPRPEKTSDAPWGPAQPRPGETVAQVRPPAREPIPNATRRRSASTPAKPREAQPPEATPLDAKPFETRPQETAPLELAREEGWLLLPREFLLLVTFATLLLAVAVYGLWRLWWWRQAWLLLERLAVKGDLQLHRIALATLVPDVVPPSRARRLARTLNRWIQKPALELDSAATVERATRRGGWVTPAYGQRRERLSYLFLIEQHSLADQQNRHLRAWLEQLRQEGVLLGWVSYQGDPGHCHGPEGRGPVQTLRELGRQRPDAVMVVVAEAETFFNPLDGSLVPWLEGLADWSRRAVLTPRPLVHWGAAERELSRHVRVLPISEEDLIQPGHLLDADNPDPLRLDAPAKLLGSLSNSALLPDPAFLSEPSLLRQRPRRLIDTTPPPQQVIGRLLADMRGHLGPEGSTWLAACAVFPELHWTITAYLGQRLQNTKGEPLLKACPMLRLARLPWFRQGFLPDWLRVPLILGLPPEQEHQVREALRNLMLVAVQGGEVGGDQLSVATRHGRHLPLLFPPLLDLLRRRAGPTSPLRDHMFLSFMQHRPLLAAEAPESLRHLLQDHLPKAGPRPHPRDLLHHPRVLLKVALALLAAAGLGLFGLERLERSNLARLVLRPSEADMYYDTNRSDHLQRAITAAGLSRSTLLSFGGRPSMAPVEAALETGLWIPGLYLRFLRAHNQRINDGAFSPDGHIFITASWDKTLRLWDVTTGQPIGPHLRGHREGVTSVAFSPDGRRIVSGSADNTLRLWDATSGQPIGSPIRGHTGWIRNVAFSPDGRRIVSSSEDLTLRFWNADTGKPIGRPLHRQSNVSLSKGFSPDGRVFVSGSDDETLHLWDVNTGKAFSLLNQAYKSGSYFRLDNRETTLWSASFSPDGRRIASLSNVNTLLIWDVATRKPIGPSLQGHITSVKDAALAFSPDSRRIVSGSEDNTLRIWDANTGQPIGSPLRGHTKRVMTVNFTPDGKRILSTSDDGTMRFWDAATGKPIGSSLRLFYVSGANVLSTNGRILAEISYEHLEFWDVDDSPLNLNTLRGNRWAVPAKVSSLIAMNSGDLISGHEDGTLRRWRDGKAYGPPIATGQPTISSLIELKNGELISGGSDGTMRRWRNGKPVGGGKPIATDQGSIILLETRNGEVVSGGDDGTLRRWRDGKPVGDGKPIATKQGELIRLIQQKNGEMISFGSFGTLRRWRDGKPAGKEENLDHGLGMAGNPTSVVVLNNGEVISGGLDGTMRRWRGGKPVGFLNKPTFLGHVIFTGQGRLQSLIELKNGELISGGSDGTLRRWRDGRPVGDGRPIATGLKSVEHLIELKTGEVISYGPDRSSNVPTLRRWPSLTPSWRVLLPRACRRLEYHPRLQSWPWLNTARATCDQLVWSQPRGTTSGVKP
jgi:WD40 repeat protein